MELREKLEHPNSSEHNKLTLCCENQDTIDNEIEHSSELLH